MKTPEHYKEFKNELKKKFELTQLEFSENFISDKVLVNGSITVHYFKKGKVMLQGSPDSEATKNICELASEIFGPEIKSISEKGKDLDLTSLNKEYFIGLDESGTGECFGPIIVGIAIITRSNLIEAQKLFKPQDAKKINEEAIIRLAQETKQFFGRETILIGAEKIDIENKIFLLDKIYIKLLENNKEYLSNSCIIVDDYGLGPELNKYLSNLESSGSIVIKSHKADSYYIPVLAASVIARKARNKSIETLGLKYKLTDPDTKEEIPLTAGSSSNPLTDKWLIAYRKLYPQSDFPFFVRKKWKNVQEIEKRMPKKDISFSFSCESCGEKFNKIFIKYNLIIKVTELICPKCSKLVDKNNFKKSFYKTSLVVDTSTLISRIISKDLSTSKYLEGMKIILPSCLYEEIDRKEPDKKKGAKNEIEFLRKSVQDGMIEFEEEDTESLNHLTYDKKVIYVTKQHNASLITKDRTQNMFASIGSFVFEILDN